MHTFFHGWRRKAGVVSVGLALGITGGWVRSRIVQDTLACVISGDTHFLVSTKEGVFWFKAPHVDAAPSVSWNSGRRTLTTRGSYLLKKGAVAFHFGREQGWFISYGSLAIPLTLLSAYLILWKPRKRA